MLATLEVCCESGDLPIVVLAEADEIAWLADLVCGRPNAVLLAKPVEPGQLRAAVEAGLRYRATRRRELELLRQLSEANASLREADRRKDEFLATLAHELRNPLAPVRSAVQVIKIKGPSDPDLDWSRDVIERQVARMARLLDDLLDVSRITRGTLELRRQRVELSAVVDDAVETSRPIIERGGHELRISLPAGPVHLDADPVRLAQIFGNLLNNAAKYTDVGGRIDLRAERAGDDVVVSVKDTGIGIAADVLPRLFDMFSQAEPALERSQGGLGIGLSLVKGLVELHGGTIVARSEGPGRGSEFIVRLAAAAVARGDEASEPAADPSPRLAGRRILVADDNGDAAESLALLLRLLGNEVRTAGDGEQAVELEADFGPDVVLLDIGMPRLNGYEAARRIREQSGDREMLLIALTGWGQEEDKRLTREAGFDHHLVKPAEPAELQRLLAAWDRRTPGAAWEPRESSTA